MTQQSGPFRALVEELKAGRVSRRDFLGHAARLGVGVPVALFVLNHTKIDAVHAQDAAPAGRPEVGTEGQTRGAGGEVKILQSQAASHASLHVSTGTKDQLAASLVTEPLLSYAPDGSLIPTLATEVPTIENGMLAEDLSSVTFKLQEGVLWSDGTPFTAADVQYTWQWIMTPENSSISSTTWAVIKDIQTPDDLTVEVTFTSPLIAWYVPFSGSYLGGIYPKHILDGGGVEASDAFRTNPIGTGPYKVESFSVDDQVIYVMNENYREPNKPYFERVNLKGGDESSLTAQAVLQTGDWDFAWNLQVEPEVLREFEKGGKGTVKASAPSNVERILINFSDPNDESMGERSHKEVPHPFWSDMNVRQALSYATDRDTMANQFYLGGDLEPPAQDILFVTGLFESTGSTPFEFNLEKAAAALDAAGWTLDGDVRTKDGRELEITYSTSINSVRQKCQAVMKDNLESIGFKVQLKRVDASVFFDSAAGNEQNAQHFYEDLLMYTNGPSSTFPLNYMASWYGGEDNISQKSNGWSGVNEARYNNEEYNALYERAVATTDAEEATELLIQMNDHVVNNIVVVPEVARAAEKYAISNTLNDANIGGSLFEALYWNIANWNRVA